MKKIKTVAMVRKIRDKQSKDTAGMSPREIINYFRKKAARISENAKAFELNKVRSEQD